VTLAVARGRAAEPPVPAPTGWVTDLAGVLPPETRDRITRLVDELRAKTGAEVAVVTVETTAPLDDFTYAMRIADAWKPGRKGEDTGVVFLVATRDRKLRVLVGYGLEAVLPDGLVGEIADREVVPAFRAGRVAEGVWRGVAALAARIAAARGVELTGAPPPAAGRPAPVPVPGWVVLVVLVLFLVMLYQASRPSRFRRGGFYPFGFGGFGGGGFGGGGGGFGGFGGGSFGGGGAGRSW
jgi:uncharacterized protein